MLHRLADAGLVAMGCSTADALSQYGMGLLGWQRRDGRIVGVLLQGREGAVWRVDQAGVLVAASAPSGLVVGATAGNNPTNL